MSRKRGMFRGRHGRGGPDDGDLDALLSDMWDGGIRAVAGTLDLEAGKAALLASGSPADGELPAAGPGALGAVLAEADVLLAAITGQLPAGTGAGPAHGLVTTFLVTARELMIQLRTGLAARALSRDDARLVIARLDHALKEAGLTVGRLPGPAAGPDSAELAWQLAGWRTQLADLAGQVDRLFDEAGNPASGVPAPAR
jgi:hypothetical protein